MADTQTPAVPAEAPKAPESVVDNQNTNTNNEAPVQPDMHGFTSEQLADMKKFFDNNGGWDKVKSRISNPEPAQPAQPVQSVQPVQPTEQPVQPAQPVQPKLDPAYKTPQAMAVENYFNNLAQAKEYEPISGDIRSGQFLKDMESMGMNPVDQYGNVNMAQVKSFLDLKVQTVHPPVATSTEPINSNAPLVEYIPVQDGKISSMEQAEAVLMQDAQLRRSGQAGHPNIKEAEDFISSTLGKKA